MKRVLILGASRYYLRAIQTAKRLGYRTLVVDRDPTLPGFQAADTGQGIDITNSGAVLDYARTQKIDGIVPINDYGVPTAAYVAEALKLPGLTRRQSRILTNKALLRDHWQKNGQPNPDYRIVGTFDACKAACDAIGYPLILKPAVSMGGSRGVVVVDSPDQLSESYRFATSFYNDKTILVEALLQGVEHSAEVLVYNGHGHVLAISDKIKTPLPYRADKNVLYPTRFTGLQRRRLENVIIASVESLEIKNGCAHVECCTLPSGDIRLFEMGGRPGGGGTPDPIVPFLTGVNEFEQYLKICVGDEPDQLHPFYEKGCNYHFLTPRPGKVKQMSGLDAVRQWDGVLDADLFVKPGDTIRPVKTGADRAGFIITGAKTRDEALALGEKAEQSLVFEYEA